MKYKKKLYLRVWKNGPPRKNQKLRKLESYKYKGFSVTLWDNHIYGFRYEWSITPLTQTALVKSQMKKIIWDPTSSRFRKGQYGASYWAKIGINEIHTRTLRRYWK